MRLPSACWHADDVIGRLEKTESGLGINWLSCRQIRRVTPPGPAPPAIRPRVITDLELPAARIEGVKGRSAECRGQLVERLLPPEAQPGQGGRGARARIGGTQAQGDAGP